MDRTATRPTCVPAYFPDGISARTEITGLKSLDVLRPWTPAERESELLRAANLPLAMAHCLDCQDRLPGVQADRFTRDPDARRVNPVGLRIALRSPVELGPTAAPAFDRKTERLQAAE